MKREELSGLRRPHQPSIAENCRLILRAQRLVRRLKTPLLIKGHQVHGQAAKKRGQRVEYSESYFRWNSANASSSIAEILSRVV